MTRAKSETTGDMQRKSILEMRLVYKNLTDHEFAAMYTNRWKIPTREILEVLGVLDAERKRSNRNRQAQ